MVVMVMVMVVVVVVVVAEVEEEMGLHQIRLYYQSVPCLPFALPAPLDCQQGDISCHENHFE